MILVFKNTEKVKARKASFPEETGIMTFPRNILS